MKFQISVWTIPLVPNQSRRMLGFMDANGDIIDCAYVKNFHCVFPTYKSALAMCSIFKWKTRAELIIEPIPEVWGGEEERKCQEFMKFCHENKLYI